MKQTDLYRYVHLQGDGTSPVAHQLVVDQTSEFYYIYLDLYPANPSSVTISAPSGTFQRMSIIDMYIVGKSTNAVGATYTIFGVTLPSTYLAKKFQVRAIYDGSAWDVFVYPSIVDTRIISGSQIVAATITNVEIENATIQLAKLANAASNSITGRAGAIGSLTQIAVGEQMLVGRLTSGVLAAIPISTLQSYFGSGGVTRLSQLIDIGLTNLATEDILIYDAEALAWVNYKLQDIVSLNYVNCDLATIVQVTGHTIIYNSVTSKWENRFINLDDIAVATVNFGDDITGTYSASVEGFVKIDSGTISPLLDGTAKNIYVPVGYAISSFIVNVISIEPLGNSRNISFSAEGLLCNIAIGFEATLGLKEVFNDDITDGISMPYSGSITFNSGAAIDPTCEVEFLIRLVKNVY